MHDGNCSQRYEQLAAIRETYLDRARQASKLTIPSLVPDAGHTYSTELQTPYQGIGARGVNNLASKLLLSLLPPNAPFFRLTVDDFTLQELTQEEGQRAVVEEALNKIERSVMSEIETTGLRSPVFEALKQLIVAGNVLMFMPKDGGARVFDLRRYVIKRDPMGEVLEIVIKEEVAPMVLDPDVRELLYSGGETAKMSPDETVNMYTKLYRTDKHWHLFQEINGNIIPGSEGKYPIEKPPMIALRWTRIDGEDYGRSYVEEYLGDLISLEGLSKAILEASAASAKVLFMVNPNGATRARDIAKAKNGDIVSGNSNEVTVLQTSKSADMRVAYDTLSRIQERLSYAFLMNTAIQRNGERVTAEEIRYMAGELEDALGGVYSILSQEFQLPLVMRLMDRMTKQRRLPSLPKGVVRPAIVTGLEALGRGHDLNRYQAFLNNLAPLGPELIGKYMNASDFIKRVGTSLGIDMDGLVKDEQELQQEMMAAQEAQQQQMLAQMAQGGVGPAVTQIGQALREQQQGAEE